MPVQTVFENLEAGMSVGEITELFDVTADEVKAVLHITSESLAKQKDLTEAIEINETAIRNRIVAIRKDRGLAPKTT